jgi:hypothetical protein
MQIRAVVQSARGGAVAVFARTDPAKALRLHALDLTREPDKFTVETDPATGAVRLVEVWWGTTRYRAVPGRRPGFVEQSVEWEVAP